MRKFNLILILVLMISSALYAAENTTTGSFLKKRATTVNQLYVQISNDSKVRKLYAKHFGVSEKELMDKFKSNVVLISLKKPMKVNSYYVGTSGKFIYVKKKLLPKGTMVFASKDGKPILLWPCGNPLITILPKESKKKVLKPEPETAAPITPPVKVESNTEVVQAPTPPMPIIEDLMPQVEEALPPAPVTNVIAPTTSLPFESIVAGVAPLLGLLVSSRDDTPPNNEVPEPPSLVLALCGLILSFSFFKFRHNYQK